MFNECAEYDLKLEGLTFRQFIEFYKTALRQEYEDLRRIAAMHGAELPPLKEEIETEEEYARAKDKDPLIDFPYDVVYLTEKQCNEQIKYYNLLKAKGIEVPEERIWDEERKAACLGDDIVAKRCSMNDVLWAEYKANPNLTIEDVERKIKIDIARSKLYPPGWTDYTTPPPNEYIQELKQKGLFQKYMDELQELIDGN